MPSRVKKSKHLAGLSNERGQAAIEYVLLLVISVSIVIALVYQIFQPMQDYVKAYMGTYVECLLETGGLPSFGGDQTSAQDMGCTMAQLKKGNSPNGVGANGVGGSGSNPDNKENSHSSSNSSGEGSGSGGSSGSSGGSASSSSRLSGRNGRSSRGGAAGLEGGAQQNSKVVEIAANGDGSGGFFGGHSGSGFNGRSRRKISTVNMDNWTEAERKKVEKKNDTGHTKVIATDEVSTPPKKISVKKPEAKIVIVEESTELGVGNFIRYLFIAALIIALVIFIGGQALSMSKGSEK